MIPIIQAAALFGPSTGERDRVDRAILAAAEDVGFVTLSGLPPEVPLDAVMRRALLAIFALPEGGKRRLYRRKFAPAASNVYRGWFPLEAGGATYKEGIDIAPDLADPGWRSDGSDPLTEGTPLPDEAELPGWRVAAAGYYLGMELLARMVMRSVARGLGLAESCFDDAFSGGISTLRLIRYPVRPPEVAARIPAAAFVEHKGRQLQIAGGAHIDSGFVTLLAQDGVEGLQARGADGSWVDVPPVEGTLAVNFGGLLEKWTGGRIKATEHRVVGSGRERCSIPFFYEPRVDAEIAPLGIAGGAPFQPFLYGDHLWASMTRFLEYRGLEDLRSPRGPGR